MLACGRRQLRPASTEPAARAASFLVSRHTARAAAVPAAALPATAAATAQAAAAAAAAQQLPEAEPLPDLRWQSQDSLASSISFSRSWSSSGGDGEGDGHGGVAPRRRWSPMHARLLSSLRQRKLLPPGSRVLVAVSGGQVGARPRQERRPCWHAVPTDACFLPRPRTPWRCWRCWPTCSSSWRCSWLWPTATMACGLTPATAQRLCSTTRGSWACRAAAWPRAASCALRCVQHLEALPAVACARARPAHACMRRDAPCRRRLATGGTSSWPCSRGRQAAAASRWGTRQLTGQRHCCCT